VKTIEPTYRGLFRAKVAESGFRSIAELSRATGVSYASLSLIVNGRAFPTSRIQKILCEVLKISISELKGTL
jgi:transcriptional regulator with XRE-family HTH domain